MRAALLNCTLFALGAISFTVAALILFVGLIGVAQRLSQGMLLDALTVAGSAALMGVIPATIGGLAAYALNRIAARQRLPRGFDVLPRR